MSQYVDLNDLLDCGITRNGLAGVDPQLVTNCCVKASGLMDGALAPKFSALLPLQNPGDDVKLHTAGLAAWLLFRRLGANPKLGSDEMLRLGWDDAQKWMDKVRQGQIIPAGLDKLSQVNPSTPRAESAARFNADTGDRTRGWRYLPGSSGRGWDGGGGNFW